jgi:hypothetical protein
MKRVYLFTLLSVVFALTLTGCGSSGNTSLSTAGAGPQNLVIQTGDATNDQIVKFELTVTNLTLTGVSPTATTGNLVSGTGEVEFVHQAGTLEPFSLAHVPAGTYSAATFTLSDPEVVVISGGVPTKIPATLTTATVNVPFTANITIGTTPTFINFDLNLTSSITLNGPPVTAATVTPTFTVSTSTVAPGGENEDDHDGKGDDVHGSITAINAPNFTINTGSTSITFVTNSSTNFNDGIKSLSDLAVGDVVEVDSTTQSDGSVVATKVERECDNKGKELEGLITTVTGTPATAITVAHQVDSSNAANAPVTANITLNANTQFQIRTDSLNLSSPPAFDASNIGKGQRIEADADGSTDPILAVKLKLREQALLGTVAATPAPTASGFTLTLSPTSAFATLTGTTSIPVSIVNGTNINATPTAGAPVRVRGLVFFNGTTYSEFATHVDNNQ